MERPTSTLRVEPDTGGVSILVRSAVPLSETQRTAIRAVCIGHYGPIGSLKFELDPAVIGGVWLRVGDTVIDGSVAGRIEQLRQSLREHLHAAATSDRQPTP